MTYETKEISNQDGQIISLYEFKWGSTVWRYASADRAVTITQDAVDVTYEPLAIADDGMVQGGSANNDLTITMQNNVALIDLFRGTPPAGSIWVTVRRRHDGDANDDWYVYWLGTVGNVGKAGVSEAKIICRTLLATFKRTGLRLAWTRGCPHMLYDTECKADPAAFGVAASITAIVNGVITVSTAGGQPAGYFDGGYLEWQATVDGTLDQRGIESSVDATNFRIFGTIDRLTVGLAVTLYPGCPLTAIACKDKFNNLPNFGGLEQMTGENPFDGVNIF